MCTLDELRSHGPNHTYHPSQWFSNPAAQALGGAGLKTTTTDFDSNQPCTLPGFKPWRSDFLVGQAWASSISACFPSCEMGVTVVPTSQDDGKDQMSAQARPRRSIRHTVAGRTQRRAAATSRPHLKSMGTRDEMRAEAWLVLTLPARGHKTPKAWHLLKREGQMGLEGTSKLEGAQWRRRWGPGRLGRCRGEDRARSPSSWLSSWVLPYPPAPSPPRPRATSSLPLPRPHRLGSGPGPGPLISNALLPLCSPQHGFF